LGDFGVSIKYSDDDPNEANYTLKGATTGYTLDKYVEGIKCGEDVYLSRN